MNNLTSLFVDTNALIRLLESERKLVKSLLDDCVIIEISPQVKTEAIKIRRTTRMKQMDSIIAASALVTGMPLVTGDNAFE